MVTAKHVRLHIKRKHNLNTSEMVYLKLSELVELVIEKAAQRAKLDGRKTVMDRDVTWVDNQVVGK